MSGYRRAMRFADTGLGWVAPSPNLRTLAALDLYPDVALIEGANLSVGRGTPHPFEWIGAPWIDGAALANALNRQATGARFAPIDFVPTEASFRGLLCHGVRVIEVDPARPPAKLGLALVATLYRLYAQRFDLAATRDAIGSQRVWNALVDGADAGIALQLGEAEAQAAGFDALRQHYLIYR
jgi:uncharacterized protein YbbC (DUF1343 family)